MPRSRAWKSAGKSAAWKPAAWLAAVLAAPGAVAQPAGVALPPVLALPDVEVVGTAPLTGSGLDRARVPANTQVLRRDDLVRSGPADALRTLDERIGGVSLDQAQGNPFQPNLVYRGFEASPLAGSPQGLAVYVNGSRFNQPFGDTTNWDLIPDIAIDRIELVGSNPAFGLNALGGAITVKLRDGFSYHGAQLELSGGSFGRIQGSAQYGVQSGNTAAYVAAAGLNDTGWRFDTPSQLRQVHGDIGWRGEASEVHLGLIAATNVLTGSGPTPVDLLATSRSAVFTYPDQTRNKYVRVNLTGTHDINDAVSLQGSAYYSNLAQRTYNGNASAAQPCDDDNAFLCLANGPALTGRGGGRIPNVLQPGLFPEFGQFAGGGPYAQLDETATDTNGFGVAGQATYKTDLFGRPNRLLAGFSFDGGRTVFSARSSIGTLTRDRDYAGPGVVISLDDGSIAPVRLATANNYYGLYVSDTFDLTPALALTASGRLNVAEVELRDQTGTALNGRHSFTRFNPAAGLTYRITPNLSAYAGYAESNRAPTPAELSCASAASPCTLTNFFVADPALKQVVARTVEAGLRGRFTAFEAAAVTWNAGLFRTGSDDDILFTSSALLGRGFFQNVGATRRQGVEAGFAVRQGPLNVFVDYSYTEATFRSAFTLGSQNNPFADADGLIQVRPGNRLPGIPAHRLKFGVQYAVTPDWTIGLTGVASSGRTLRGDEANQNPRTSPYVVLNLNTSYHITKNIEAFGLVQNLLNEKYETFGSFSPLGLVPILQAAGTTSTRSLTAGAPLAGYGGLRVTF